MQYAFDRFRTEIAHALLNTGLVEPEEIELGPPTARGVQADLALPCFEAARRRHDSPSRLARQVAIEVGASIQPGSLIDAAEANSGFVNFRIAEQALIVQTLTEITQHGDRYGSDDRGAGRTVVIDYSSPNIAKRMHVGHIRSTIIGQALVNIFRAQGFTVVGDNHLGDWGKQFGVLLAAIDRRGLPQGEGEELLARFEQLYADFAKATERDPALDDEARRWSLRLEQGDPAAHEIWQRCVDLTKQVNQRNYDWLGVRFDIEHGESFYAHMTQQVIDDALSSGAARRDADGAVIVDVAGLPAFLLQRSDGGTLYHTRDLATIKFRQDTYHPAKIIYVVGKPQELHFQQLFATARAMSY
ncbi:MAG TPA: arginine--tRNA ligase, partial [Anaerolineae bacterium]|nr:arginine--tRNA ligase [Anaerolineae bacterium]